MVFQTPIFLVWSLLPGYLFLQEPPPDKQRDAKPIITITIVDGAFAYPKVDYLMLTVRPTGSISDLDTGPIDDEHLARMIVKSLDPKSGKRYIRLKASDDQAVSVETLGKALKRLKSLAPKDGELVIFVSLNLSLD